jgi:putative flippase GtrA
MQLANAVGVCLGITLSFTLNRLFTFEARDETLRRFAIFFGVGMIGLALSAAILAAGTRLGFSAIVVKGCAVVLVAAVQFVLNRTITFRAKRATA